MHPPAAMRRLSACLLLILPISIAHCHGVSPAWRAEWQQRPEINLRKHAKNFANALTLEGCVAFRTGRSEPIRPKIFSLCRNKIAACNFAGTLVCCRIETALIATV